MSFLQMILELRKWSNELHRDNMPGFLDEVLPLLHLCCVQRDLIIGVSGNSCKSCRYFIKQSCRFIPGAWSSLNLRYVASSTLSNTKFQPHFRQADMKFRSFAEFLTLGTQISILGIWKLAYNDWILSKIVINKHRARQTSKNSHVDGTTI